MPRRRGRRETGEPFRSHRLTLATLSRMRHFKLTIAYDGTDFHGWQIQSDKPTIQGEIVSILTKITQEHSALHGAGRTDAGVHALGQVGSFRTQSPLSAAEFQRALNALLPPTIRIMQAEEVGPDFNARWSARGKTYRYRLYRGRILPPRYGATCCTIPFHWRKTPCATPPRVSSAFTISLRSPLPLVPKRKTKSAPPNVKFTPRNLFARPTTKNWCSPSAADR